MLNKEFKVKDLAKILSTLPEDIPAPEISKCYGENEDWESCKDFSLEWYNHKGSVDLSVFKDNDSQVKVLYIHLKKPKFLDHVRNPTNEQIVDYLFKLFG